MTDLRNPPLETERKMTELKSCPFCGGKAHHRCGGPGNHYVKCFDCGVSTDDGSQERAIAAWNRRALPLPLEETGWRHMDTAPLDGKHCILAVKGSGGFVYSVQGAFQLGQWNCVMGDNVQPLCWMPNVRIPDEFLPWKNAPAAPSSTSGGGK